VPRRRRDGKAGPIRSARTGAASVSLPVKRLWALALVGYPQIAWIGSRSWYPQIAQIAQIECRREAGRIGSLIEIDAVLLACLYKIPVFLS